MLGGIDSTNPRSDRGLSLCGILPEFVIRAKDRVADDGSVEYRFIGASRAKGGSLAREAAWFITIERARFSTFGSTDLHSTRGAFVRQQRTDCWGKQ